MSFKWIRGDFDYDKRRTEGKIILASSIEEVKELLSEYSELDAERIWKEIDNRRSKKKEKPDLDELDAVSGGADRDWKKAGCAATCEPTSWCWSNDKCEIWDVTYDNFWATCPDGREHVFVDYICTRWGYYKSHTTPKDCPPI